MVREALVRLKENKIFFRFYRTVFTGSYFFGVFIAVKMLVIVLLLAPVPVHGADAVVKLPEDASATRKENKWRCDVGSRKVGKSCVPIKLPDNAYLTNNAYGRGWECDRGYIERYDACIAIHIPDHAFLVSQRGDVWKCERGYSAVKGSCIEIQVPEHAYLSSSGNGSGWACERGYRAKTEGCFALDVPANAHIDYSGHGWQCDRPYRKRAGICVQP